MLARLLLYVAYVLGLAACGAVVVKLTAATAFVALVSMQPASRPPHISLVEQRKIDAAESLPAVKEPFPAPVKVLSPPAVSAEALAAALDDSESADNPPLPRQSVPLRVGEHAPCERACRLALERRIKNLE
jgi:hypothetical protein